MKTLIASVIIGGMFGSASATVESIDAEVMVVEIEVGVLGAPSSVVAHLSWEDQELVLPLLDRGEGVFGITTELPLRNYFVVFEVVGEEDERSDPVSLTQLGADLGNGSEGAATSESGDDLSSDSRQMLWLAVALGAASLSALAFWVLGGRDDDDEESDDQTSDVEESDDEVGPVETAPKGEESRPDEEE